MRVHVTWAGFCLPRFSVCVVAALVVLSMLGGVARPAAAVPQSDEVPTAHESDDSDGDGIPDREDLVSAAVTARLLGVPVEDMSQRTETIRVLVNPDGSLTQEAVSSAVRLRDDRGNWRDVDYTLVEGSDGRYRPRWAPADVSIGGGANEVAAVAFSDGGRVDLTWPDELPEPVIDGGIATFEVSEKVDLLVALTARGIVTHIRLNERPLPGETPVFELGLEASGIQIEEGEGGTLAFSKDEVAVETTAQVVAWDAQRDEAGDPLEIVPVPIALESSAAARGRNSTRHTLELSAPASFLEDPETQFPVIIDPDISAVTFSQDAWIRNGTSGNYGDDFRLLVGRLASSGNNNATISLLQWDTAEISGKTIVKSTLSLFQYASGTCKDRLMNIHPLGEPWVESTVRWSNRPPINAGTGTTGRLYLNKGRSGCTPNGFVETDITGMVQGWADGPANGGFANNGFQMNVPSDKQSDVTYERRFCSSEFNVTHTSCTSIDVVPRLSVTYNGPPGVPGAASTPSSRTFNGGLYAAGVRPVWSVAATDPEASRVTYEFELRSTSAGPVLGTCTTSQVASGAVASCAPDVDLIDGHLYVLRARAVDEFGLESPWSAGQEFTSDQTQPGAVTIDCEDYDDNTWYGENNPGTTTCDVSATNVVDFEWRRTTAGTVEDKTALPAIAGAATTPAIDVPANGVMRIEVRGKSRSGLASPWKSYTFGVGTSVLTEPLRDDRSTSTFPVRASANEGATSAEIQWRYAPEIEDDATTGWSDATQVKLASTGFAWDGTVSGTGISQTPRLMWTPIQEAGVQAPSVLQVRVVFNYPGDVKMPSPAQPIQVIPHAFGSSFPTKEIGPVDVGLFSGEMRFTSVDVDIPGPDDSLTFARTHLSLAGEHAGPAGVLGPGWIADFGNGEGASGFVVLDRTATDGTITLMSPQGEAYTYAHSSGTIGDLKTGLYKGVGETKLQQDTLNLSTGGGAGYSHVLTLTERSGVVTEFKRTTSGVWGTERVIQPKESGETTYVRNSAGLVTWIFSPHVSGLKCTTSTQEKGCRALRFTYETVAGQQRLSKVELRAWNPKPTASGLPNASASMSFREVARYAYDANGYLQEQWAPQATGDVGTTPLKTTYEYDTAGGRTKLSKITNPGLKPWRFDYDGEGRLATVKRAHDPAAGTGDATWSVHYEVPLTGPGLPSMGLEDVAAWGQHEADAPVGVAAVWGPNRIPATNPSAADYEYAFLAYHSQAGRTVNAAEFGAGSWQIDSLRYDAHGNITWELGAAGRSQALSESSDPEISAGFADKYAAFTNYNAIGTRIENTYSPMQTVVLDNGDTVVGRTTTATDYDDEADASLMPGYPTSGVPDGGFDLPVEARVAVTDKLHPAATGNIWDSKKTRYRYDKINSADADTWKTGNPTRVLSQDGAGWATHLRRYDKYGYLVESRDPAGTAVVDGTANDVFSTKYVYYTANADASESACRNKPEWAGLICVTKPGGKPSAGYAVPTMKTTGYTMRWSVSRIEEVGGTATRVNAIDYDYLGREESRTVAVTGSGASSVAVTAKATSYATATGQITSINAGTSGTESFTYDTWARVKTRTDSTGNTASTTYDATGRIATFDDGKGTYTYTYDGNDSRGAKERRGLLTSVDVDLVSVPDTITGAYDANGALIEQNYPGDITAIWERDITGTPISLTYLQDDTALLSFSQTYDHYGRVHSATGPDSSQTYTYDDRDRLIRVEDTHQGACFIRSYGFDAASNRTKFRNYAPGAGGTCQDTLTMEDTTTTFDTGDRITTTGYVHDRLGRATTVPAIHTDEPSGSALTIEYFANDMVRALVQTIPDDESGTAQLKQEFDLDVFDRLRSTKTYVSGVQLSETINKFSGDGDGPAWTTSKTRPAASTAWTTTWTRNIGDLTGSMAILQPESGNPRIQLADLRGNLVGSISIGVLGLSSFGTYTEYGKARVGVPDDYEGYGWLGSHARKSAGNVGGLTLMGARLYNPETGRFLSRDPVAGGNDNAYVYPPDPINMKDLSGEAGLFSLVRFVIRVIKHVLKTLKFVPSTAPKPKPTPKKKIKPKAKQKSSASRSVVGSLQDYKRGGADGNRYSNKKESGLGVSLDCGLSYVGHLLSTVGFIAAPFTGGASLVVISGTGYAISAILTYRTCR